MAELDDVRAEIRRLDDEIARLVRERVDAARRAGEVKRRQGLGLRDHEVESDVVDRMADTFEDRGLEASTGEDVARLLIGEALRAQEQDELTPAKGRRGRVLIVGGAGAMGSWLARFLHGLGFEVLVHDVAGPLEGFPYTTDLQGAAHEVDLVLLSTPPDETRDVLEQLEGVEALVLDIASLKSPIEDTLVELAAEQPVASVHPLWGPQTRVLSDKNVLVLDCGNPEAAREARELFELSAANVVELPLEDHDPMMALTLGLPHALNLAYAEVLAHSERAYEAIEACGGPTFLKQTSVAAEVAGEDPDLYRQIQALNEATPAVYDALRDALDALEGRIDDPGAFREAMRAYDETIGDAQRWIHP
jgi:chorismate mutase/prephenate dehydrogenase